MVQYLLKTIVIIITTLACFQFSYAQYTRQDTLRGSIGSGRAWWNVKNYNISVDVDIANKRISGYNQITFSVIKGGSNKIMQVDLQEPMDIEKVQDVSDNNKSVGSY